MKQFEMKIGQSRSVNTDDGLGARSWDKSWAINACRVLCGISLLSTLLYFYISTFQNEICRRGPFKQLWSTLLYFHNFTFLLDPGIPGVSGIVLMRYAADGERDFASNSEHVITFLHFPHFQMKYAAEETEGGGPANSTSVSEHFITRFTLLHKFRSSRGWKIHQDPHIWSSDSEPVSLLPRCKWFSWTHILFSFGHGSFHYAPTFALINMAWMHDILRKSFFQQRKT